MYRVVMIGAGNLSTQLALAMQRKGIEIAQVYSHTSQSAKGLGMRLGVAHTDSLDDIPTDADLYLFAVKDSVLESVVAQMPHTTGIWAHTAGSMPIQLFDKHHANYGSFYPLQTFSKEREVCFDQIPLFIEGCNAEVEETLCQIAQQLTTKVHLANSDQRRYLHLAAVFACNFTNHMYHISAHLLAENGLPIDALVPLIDETAAKVHTMHPRQAQTGPAVRYDTNVIERHISMLTDERLKEIYQKLSESIHQQL